MEADVLVLLDNVNFKKGGWINRNVVVINDTPLWLTIPLVKQSQNRLISEHEIGDISNLRQRIFGLRRVFVGRRDFEELRSGSVLLDEMLDGLVGNLAGSLERHLSLVSNHLGFGVEILSASKILPRDSISAEDYLINVVEQLGGTEYLNLPGGRALYSKANFERHNIALSFIDEPPTETHLRAFPFQSLAYHLLSSETDALLDKLKFVGITRA